MMHDLSLMGTLDRLSKQRSTSMMITHLDSFHQQNDTTLELLQDLCGVLAAFTYRLLSDHLPGGQYHSSDEKLQQSPTLMLSASIIFHSRTGCCERSRVHTPSRWKARSSLLITRAWFLAKDGRERRKLSFCSWPNSLQETYGFSSRRGQL